MSVFPSKGMFTIENKIIASQTFVFNFPKANLKELSAEKKMW